MTHEEPDRPRIYVFYDYTCPYAYIGWARAKRLAEELGLDVQWVPWELWDTNAPLGEPYTYDPPATHPFKAWPDRLAAEEGLTLNRPKFSMSTTLALRGAEVAKGHGPDVFARYHALVFEAVWRRGLNIGDESVLAGLAGEAGMDPQAFLKAVWHPAYGARLAEARQVAAALGIQRVPTFVFGDQRVVGNDLYEPSLRGPVAAWLERRRAFKGKSSSLEDDVGVDALL